MIENVGSKGNKKILIKEWVSRVYLRKEAENKILINGDYEGRRKKEENNTSKMKAYYENHWTKRTKSNKYKRLTSV